MELRYFNWFLFVDPENPTNGHAKAVNLKDIEISWSGEVGVTYEVFIQVQKGFKSVLSDKNSNQMKTSCSKLLSGNWTKRNFIDTNLQWNCRNWTIHSRRQIPIEKNWLRGIKELRFKFESMFM